MKLRKEYRREIKEAIWACDEAIHYLDKAKKSLNKAQGWGIFDLLGGKKFITFLKRRQINKAEKSMLKGKKAIEKLNKELLDVTEIVDVDFDMGFVLSVADYFFGGAVADWIVLGRIGEGKKQIREAKKQVLEIKIELESLLL